MRDKEAISHIKNEELRNEYPAVCCGVLLKNETDLDCHLADVHGFRVKVNAISSPKDEMDDEKSDGFVIPKDENEEKVNGLAEDTSLLPSQTEIATKEEFRGEALPSSTPLDAILLPMMSQDASPVDVPSFVTANSRSFGADWSEPASQTSLSGSLSQTPSSDLVGSGGPPDFMWDYVLLSPAPSRSPSPLLNTPSGDKFSDSDGSARQSLTALHSPLDLCSPSTTTEPMTLEEELSQGFPPAQLRLDRSGTFDLNTSGHDGGTHNAPTDLTLSPKEILPSRGRESRLAEDKDAPLSHRIILKTTGPKAQGSSAGSRKQDKKRNASSRGMDDRADPPKRRIVLKKNEPKEETALPKRRIVLKVKGC